MRVLLAAVLTLGLTCGPPPIVRPPSCCTPTSVQRGFGYVGTFVGDGGVSTQVQLILGTNGVATVSFVRGSDQVVETFQTVSR